MNTTNCIAVTVCQALTDQALRVLTRNNIHPKEAARGATETVFIVYTSRTPAAIQDLIWKALPGISCKAVQAR